MSSIKECNCIQLGQEIYMRTHSADYINQSYINHSADYKSVGDILAWGVNKIKQVTKMNYVHLRNVSILSTFIDSCTAAEKSRLD